MSEKKKNRGQKQSSFENRNPKNSTVLSDDTVLIVGGGASGLMAAIMAARSGAKVTLLEHNEKNGKKLNATGNGKCNFTNKKWEESFIRGEHPEFAEYALSAFSVEKTLAFFRELGVVPIEKNGYYYPKSGQASAVTALLNLEAAELGVKMKTKEHVRELKPFEAISINGKKGQFWQVLTEGWHYEAKKVILACGSCASSIQGADGSGYELARMLGHKVIPPMPALTGLRLHDPSHIFSKWAGVRTDGVVQVFVNNQCVAVAEGEIQLTDYGVSGIPVFQVSRYAIRALAEGKDVKVHLDFLPEMSVEEVKKIIEQRKTIHPDRSEQELYLGWLPDKLSSALSQNGEMAENLKNLIFAVKEGMPFSNAQVASGGVSTLEIDEKTLESKLCKGIYFCGELIDIDGTCGGYNLQWAWSSGAAAGKSAAEKE